MISCQGSGQSKVIKRTTFKMNISHKKRKLMVDISLRNANVNLLFSACSLELKHAFRKRPFQFWRFRHFALDNWNIVYNIMCGYMVLYAICGIYGSLDKGWFVTLMYHTWSVFISRTHISLERVMASDPGGVPPWPVWSRWNKKLSIIECFEYFSMNFSGWQQHHILLRPSLISASLPDMFHALGRFIFERQFWQNMMI